MNCFICGNESGNRFFLVREMMFGTGEAFEYMQCSLCECLQLKTPPDDLSKFYPDNYYSFESRPGRHWIKRFIATQRNIYAVKGKSFLGSYLYQKFPAPVLRSLSRASLTNRSRVLDVGCGSGQILRVLGDIGFRNVLGIDPFVAKSFVHSNGVRVDKKSLFELAGQWDFIMFHHSFEHMPDPAQVLKQVFSLLGKDGCCLIRIPTTSSHAWRRYRENWVQIDAPRHLFLHSIASMEKLAEDAGLCLSRVEYDSTAFQFWGSEQCQRNVPLTSSLSYLKHPDASGFRPEQIDEYTRLAQLANDSQRGDQAAFYLKKASDVLCSDGAKSFGA